MNAHVVLFRDRDRTVAYDFAIGGQDNQLCYITRGNATKWGQDQEASTPGILKCSQSITFQIEWGPAALVLKDEHGANILYWEDTNYLTVTSLSFYSDLYQAVYTIPRRTGRYLFYLLINY